MSNWPKNVGIGKAISYGNAASPYAIIVASANAANTKSDSWVELVSSTPYNGLLSLTLGRTTTIGGWLVDIAVGGAGSESVVIENIGFSYSVYATYFNFDSRLFLPAGSRITAKSQSTYTSTNNIRVIPTLNSFNGFTMSNSSACYRYATYGAATSDSGGTAVDPGGTVDTKGAWTEITSSVGFDAKGLIVTFTGYNNAPADYTWYFDIGIGSAGNEVPIVENFLITTFASTSVYNFSPPNTFNFPINLPSGTRLSARSQCSGNNSTDRLVDIILYVYS